MADEARGLSRHRPTECAKDRAAPRRHRVANPIATSNVMPGLAPDVHDIASREIMAGASPAMMSSLMDSAAA